MGTTLLIVAASVGGLLLILLLLSLITRGVAVAAQARIDARFGKGDIQLSDARANCFGVESKGPMQLRGNGGLVLTESQLCFLPLVGLPELTIERSTVRGVSVVWSHLGKTVGRKLLRVEYVVDGKPDAVAWFVIDAQRWVDALR